MRVGRVAGACVLGYAVVAILGSITKLVVEAASDITYELHWFTTMPVIALAFAYMLYRRWTVVKPA